MERTVTEPEEAETRRHSRRSDPWKAAFVVLLIVALLAVVTWVLLGSRLLVVRDVEVGGLQRMSENEVVDALGVATGTPLAKVDTDAARRRVEGLRLAESAEIVREWPATLRVRVTERTPRLAVQVGSGFRLIDADGVRIEDTDARPEGIPQVTIKGEVEGNPAVAEAARIAAELPDDLLARAESIEARDRASITLVFADGGRVVWGDGERTAEKAKILQVLLREHPSGPDRRYDVSAPGMAVVK